MKFTIALLLLTFFSSSWAQKTPDKISDASKPLAASGGSVGSGGDGNTSEEVIILNMIRGNLLKLEKFLRTDQKARDYFSEIDPQEFSRRILDVVKNNKIKIVKDGDAENDNDQQTDIYDKYRVPRTAVNYSDTNIIEYDFEKVSKLENKPKALFVLNAHEILSLMGLEETDPKKPDQYMGYKVSGKFSQFVTKVSNYDLRFTDEIVSELSKGCRVYNIVKLSGATRIIRGGKYIESFNLLTIKSGNILQSKGYEIVTDANAADFSLEIQLRKELKLGGFIEETVTKARLAISHLGKKVESFSMGKKFFKAHPQNIKYKRKAYKTRSASKEREFLSKVDPSLDTDGANLIKALNKVKNCDEYL